jgi:hypothetical protein
MTNPKWLDIRDDSERTVSVTQLAGGARLGITITVPRILDSDLFTVLTAAEAFALRDFINAHITAPEE